MSSTGARPLQPTRSRAPRTRHPPRRPRADRGRGAELTAHRHSLRVRYHECDPQGVVFNANYLAYADMAISELFRDALGSWEAPMREHELDMVVAEATVRYLAPLRFDEEVELVTVVEHLGETSMRTTVAVERGGEPAAEVALRHVFVGAETRTKAPMPPAVRDALARYVPDA